MTLIPTKEDFVNDVYTYAISDALEIVFCSLNEQYESNGETLNMNNILIEARLNQDGVVSHLPCPNIVGVNNDFLSVQSDDATLQGKEISYENLGLWRVEING